MIERCSMEKWRFLQIWIWFLDLLETSLEFANVYVF